MSFRLKSWVSAVVSASIIISSALPVGTAKKETSDKIMKSFAVSAEESETTDVVIPELNIPTKNIPSNEAMEFVSDMRLGWNLGNTLDAYDDTGWVPTKMDIETCWTNGPKTNQEMIDAVKAAGFNTIRVPVSWHNHIDDNYNIDEEWMARVQEVVDYAYNRGLYVIINSHHDNSLDTMYPDSEHYEQSAELMKALWVQIADRFKDYDNHLIMETMNEPRLVGDANEWWIDFNRDECIDSIKTINRLNQDIVDVIRKSGGNNADRYISVPGYDCSVDGVTNEYFELPVDSVNNKIIVAVHAYIPYHFALEDADSPTAVDTFTIGSADTDEIDAAFDSVYEKFVSKGIPVYVGEFAAFDKGGNLQARTDYAAYYIAATKARGITSCWWDVYDLLERKSCTWKTPEIVQALNQYAGESDREIIIPPYEDSEDDSPNPPEYTGDYETVVPDKDSNVTFSQAIGDTIEIDLELKEDTGFVNGCVGFTLPVDGKKYWIAYSWQAKSSGTITLDMTNPFQVSELIGDKAEPTDDEAVIKAAAEVVMKQKSAMLQFWWASDNISGAEISPASDAATITAVRIKAGEVAKASGDVNGDGEFNVADVVLLQKWLLAVPDTTLADWKAGNYIDDDRLDVFDLVMMKRALLNQS